MISHRVPLHSRRSQNGQAVVEFAVVAGAVLVLLFLALAMLGRFGDVRNKTLMASRYTAWERTIYLDDSNWNKYGASVTKTGQALRSEMVQRVMGHDAVLQSGDGARNALPSAGMPMWHDTAGRNLLTNYDDITLKTGRQRTGTPLDAAVSVLDAGGAVGAGFDLPDNNQQSTQVSLVVGANSAALHRLWENWNGFTATDTNVLLTNGWTPDGRDGVLAQVANAAPLHRGEFIGNAALSPLVVLAPDITGLDLGKIAPDVVPADRLGK
jgi:hypothetical protein